MKKSIVARVLVLLLALALIMSSAVYAEEAAEKTSEAATEETEVEYPTFGSDEEFAECLKEILSKYTYQKVSVGLCYTKTGETMIINGEEWYNPGSIYKLPMVMNVTNSIKNGETERYEHVFSTDMEEAIHSILEYSNNTYSMELVEAYTVQELADNVVALSGVQPDEKGMKKLMRPAYNAEYTPEMVMGILKTLYGNSEEYPNVIQYMTEASPCLYLRHSLEGEYIIAQKYGSVEYVNHIAGIIYRENPILVVIMTEGFGSSSGETVIGKIAVLLDEYAKVLDERAAAYEKEHGEFEPALYSDVPDVELKKVSRANVNTYYWGDSSSSEASEEPAEQNPGSAVTPTEPETPTEPTTPEPPAESGGDPTPVEPPAESGGGSSSEAPAETEG